MEKSNSCDNVHNEGNKVCNQCIDNGHTSVNSCDIKDEENKAHNQCEENRVVSTVEQVRVGEEIVCHKSPISRKKLKKHKIVALVGIVVVAIIVAINLFNPVSCVMRDIEEGDFLNATSIYQKEIVNDNVKYQKTFDEVSSYVKEILEQYRNQKITYDFLINKLYGIEQIGVLGQEITYAYTEAEYLYVCRENFAFAEKAFDSGNYKEAVQLYGQVANADFENGQDANEKYNQSVELYRTEIINNVQEYIDSNEYSMAMTLLEDALCILPNDAELLSVQQFCIQSEYDENVQSLVKEAQIYIKNKDYVGALSFFDSCISNYPEELLFQQERNKCLDDYESYVIDESLRLAGAGEYRNARTLAESGLNYFESIKVTELAMVYDSHIPRILGEMEMFQNNTKGGSWVTNTDNTNVYLEDNYGNVYSNSLSVGCGSVTYLVNFKFQTLSGTVAFPKGLESDIYRKSATLVIYGDDEKIAEFVDFNEESKPEEFSLNISSYERVTLEWTCKGGNIWGDWGYFATIFDGIFEPIPLELPVTE